MTRVVQLAMALYLALSVSRVAGEPWASASTVTTTGPKIRLLKVQVPFKVVPAIYGDTVAWGGTDVLPHPSHIYLSKVDPFVPRSVVVSSKGDLFNDIQLSSRWLAWIEYSAVTLTWFIRVRNLRTGKTRDIDKAVKSGVSTNPLQIPLVSLFGDSIAWSRITCAQAHCGDSWRSSIHLMDLRSRHSITVRLTTSPCLQTLPSLSQKLLVWDQEGTCRGAAGADILMYDRRAHRVTRVTNNHLSSFATTNGLDIAWKQADPINRANPRMANGSILLFDLRSGHRTAVSRPRSCHDPQTGWSSCSTLPRLTKDALAWLGENGSTVEALTLSGHRRFTLSRYHEQGHFILAPGLIGWGWGKSVIWEQDKQNPNTGGGAQYIAIATLP